MNNQKNIIEIHDLKKSYDKGKIKALNNINLIQRVAIARALVNHPSIILTNMKVKCGLT